MTAAVSQRRRDIDIARGIAIILIVIHHVTQYMMRYNPSFLSKQMEFSIISVLSLANIPSFMFLAGTVLALGKKQYASLNSYFSFELGKLQRLILPFFAISFIQVAIKLVAPGRSVSELPDALLHTLIAPRGGVAGHLWFLYCLMSVFIIWPVLIKFTGTERFPLYLAVPAVLAVLPIHWPMDNCPSAHPILGLRDTVWYLPIFAAGYWHGNGLIYKKKLGLAGLSITVSFFLAGTCAALFINWPQGPWMLLLQQIIRLTTSIAAALSILQLAGIIENISYTGSSYLSTAGFYSYDIYLLHVAFVGHPMAFLISKLNIGVAAVYALFTLTLLAAIIIPIGMSKIIRRYPNLAYVVLGLPRKTFA